MPITSEHLGEEISKLELHMKNLKDPYEIVMAKSQIFIIRLLKDIRNNIYLLSENKKPYKSKSNIIIKKGEQTQEKTDNEPKK